MSDEAFYQQGSRELQDRFDTRRLADRLEDVIVHDRFTDHDAAFIEARDMFFLATADEHGRPTVSYKGGAPGFVKVVDDTTLAFPNYDGNGMYLSMGNIVDTHHVGMLFIDFEHRNRLRVNGEASVDLDDPTARRLARGAVRRAGATDGDLPELPPVHPPHARGRRRRRSCRARTARRRCRRGSATTGPTTSCLPAIRRRDPDAEVRGE